MNEIELAHLTEIKETEIIELMSNEMVGKQLPLLNGGFTTEDCRAFLNDKKQLWSKHGYGPYALRINGKFAGWGGLQAEDGDADFALVLHPDFWGWGLRIFRKIREEAFSEMGLESITALLPPSRPNTKAITRLGFVQDGQKTISGQIFLKFRLFNPGRSP